MNEELLKAIFENEGFAKKGVTYEQFKVDIKDPSLQEAIFNNAGFSKKGIDFDTFKNDLGINIHQSNIPSSFQDPNRNSKDKGYRNNNPLNIKDFKTGKFKVFNNLEEGYIASEKDLSKKLSGKSPALIENLQKQGKSWGDATLADVILTWAPPSDNSKSALNNYIKSVGGDLGVDPYKVHPSQVNARDLTIAMSKVESPASYNTLKQFNSNNTPKSNVNQQQVPVEQPSLTQLIDTEAKELAEKKLDEKYNKLGIKDKFLTDIDRSNVFTGLIGSLFDGKANRLAATDAEIFEAKKELLASGKYGNFKSAEELAVILDPKYKEKMLATADAAEKVKQGLEEDFETDSIFDSMWGQVGMKKNSKGENIVNINPQAFLDYKLPKENYIKQEDVLKLTEHPAITADRKKYNYREQKELNQHLRNIQSELTKSEQIGRTAATGIYNNYLDYASKRAKKLETDLISKYGTLDPNKMSEEVKAQIQVDPLYKDLTELGDAYNKEYETLRTKNEQFKLAEVNDYLTKEFNKKEDENYKKNYSKLGYVEKALQNTNMFLADAIGALANVPEDLGVLGGVYVDAALDTNIATTKAISNAYDAEKIKSSNISTNLLPSQVKLDNKDIYAIYDKNGKIEKFTDGSYFTITDDPNDETFKQLLIEEKKSKNSGKPTAGFNTDNFLHSVREPMVDMVPLIFGGGAAKSILTKGASMLGNTGRLANVLTKTANSPRFLTFAGSFAGFTGKMMDSAIKEGGLVDPLDIAVSTTAKVGLEAVIEAANPLGGAVFTDKLFSSLTKTQVRELSKIITEQGVFKALPIISRKFGKEILENGLGESMEEILATIAEPVFVNKILNATLDTTFDENFSVKDVAESALVGMASGFAMGGILESGPTALSAINNPSSVIQESLRAALQNKQIFDKIIEENKNVDLQNASDQDVEKVKAKYDNIKKIMDNAAIYSEKVFKEHPDTGHVPSSGMQTLYSNVAFNKARKENKKYDLEEDVNKNIASIDQDTKKLKELDLFIGAGLDFFNGIADTNKEAKIMSDTELKDNYFTVYNDVKDIVAKIGNKKNSDAQKLALIKAETKLALIKAKNKTENKVDDSVKSKVEEELKTETSKAKEEEVVIKAAEAVKTNTATREQLSIIEGEEKKSVDDWFNLYEKELRNDSISSDAIVQLFENNKTQLNYIDKRLKDLDLEKYIQQAEELSKQESKAKPTAKVGFFARYNGNPELENVEHQTFTNSFESYLKEKLNDLDPSSLFYGQDVDEINTLVNEVSDPNSVFNNSTYEEKYNNYPFFRELVDEATKTTKKPAKYTEPKRKPAAKKEPVKKESTKKEDLKDNKQELLNIEAKKADIERRKQALRDLMKATGDDIFMLGVEDGTFMGEALLNMNENGDVVLTRYTDSEEGLTKGKGKTKNLKDIAGQFGGEQIATSGAEGGLASFANSVVGEYHIPLQELIDLIKSEDVVFAGLGNKEFVLSPHIADKYLAKINGKEINTKYDAETDIERRRQELNFYTVDKLKTDSNYSGYINSEGNIYDGYQIIFDKTVAYANKIAYALSKIGKELPNKNGKREFLLEVEGQEFKVTVNFDGSLGFKNGEFNISLKPFNGTENVNTVISDLQMHLNQVGREVLQKETGKLSKSEFVFEKNFKEEFDAKYDAELKALEQQPTQSEIEAKKAEIERRDYLLSKEYKNFGWLSEKEKNDYLKLQEDSKNSEDREKAYLKLRQLYKEKVDRKFIDSVEKIHWVRNIESLVSLLENGKTIPFEISAEGYFKESFKSGWGNGIGIKLKGETLLASNEDLRSDNKYGSIKNGDFRKYSYGDSTSMILNKDSFLTHNLLEFEERGKKYQGHNEFLLKNSEIEAIVIDETNSKLTKEFKLEVEKLATKFGIPTIINAKYDVELAKLEETASETKIEAKKADYKVLETFLPTGGNLEYTIRIQNNKTGEKGSYSIDNTGRWVVAKFNDKTGYYEIVSKPLSQKQIITSAKTALGEDFINKLNSIKSEIDKVTDEKGGEKFEKFLELLKKYDAELAVLIDKSPEKEPEKPGRGTTKNQGRLSISVDGYNAINIANNKLINENLLKGDPIYYRIEQKNGKDKIISVLYFKNGKFVSKEDGGKEIFAGQLNITDKTIELADRIKGSKDGFIKAVVSNSPYYNKGTSKKQEKNVANKSKLTPDEIAALRPNMYIIGQDYQSNNLLVLSNKETDGQPSMLIEDFIDRYLEKNPQYKNQKQNLKTILSNPTPNFLNGKAFVIQGGEIILFDVLANKDIPENVERIKQRIEELSTGSKYIQKENDTANEDGYVQASTIDLLDIVAKRDESLDDSKNSGIPNVHGKLLEFFAAGKQVIGEQIARNEEIKPLYKLSRKEGDQELSKKYLTQEEVVQELLNIRANIDHDTLRGDDPDYNEYLSKIIEIPYGVENGRAIFYNVINTIIEEAESVITADIPIVPETEAKPENKEKLDIISEPLNSSTIIIDDSNIDFKASDKDYSGRIEEAVDYIKNRFEEIGVEIDDVILRNLVKGTSAEGSKVWGAFHNAMVTLSSISGEKVGKHEAIHVAEVMFHTDTQIKAFRQEALVKYGKELGISKTKVEDLTDEELKEIRETLATEFEDYKNTLLLPEGFNKKYPTIAKFINNLFNFLKKNYLIGRSYITNKKSIDQLFYEVENNILGRDFLGRRKKSIRDVFEKALNNLSKPDFKVSNWDTKTTYNFADFIVKDLFSNYLENKYTVRSLSEVLAKYKRFTTTSIFNDFKNNLKTIIEDYKQEVIDRKKLIPGTDAYNSFVTIMDDIFTQAGSENKNKQFESIIDKKLEQRAYAGSTLAALEKDDDVDNLSESEKELKDEEEDSTREAWQVKSGKIDAKTKSSVRLREFFASLPKAARIIKDGKSSRSVITSTITFNTLYYDGQYIHNKLLVELSDNSNYEDFIIAINNLVPKYQFAGDIIAKILNLREEQLMEAYDNNTLALPLDIFTNTEKHDDYNIWLLKDMYQAIGDQTNQNPLKTLSKIKGKRVISSQVVNSVKETDLKNAKRTLIDTIEERVKNDTQKQDLIDKINTLLDKIENNKPVSGSIKEVFSALGYGATEELLLHLQPSVFMTGELNNLSELKLALNGLKRGLDNNQKFDETDSNISKLAKLISTYSTVSSGLSYINVENENEFSHRNSSYLSRINAIWLKGDAKLKEWIKDMTTYTEVVNGEEITYNVLGQFRNPAYQDLLVKKYKYRFFEDGFIQVDGQSNNGKVYSDYSPDEVLSSSINLFLGKNNAAKEANTIKDKVGTLEHALFHIGVNSDAGQRNILHAPIFNLSAISQKLSEMIYGEIERIFYVKKGQTAEYQNLKIAGEFFQHIPELNTIRFKLVNGSIKTFSEVFTAVNKEETKLLWDEYNKNTNLPKIISMAMINKVTGKYGEIPITGVTYDGVLQEVIKKVLANNATNFMEELNKKDFFNNAKSPIAIANKSELEDYYYNTFYNNVVFSNMLAGDPANYKKNKKNNKTDIEWFKRFKQLISPGIRKAFSRENFSVLILKDVEINSTLFKDQASITDAQGVHTLKRRLEIMRADADWDLKKDEIENTVKFIDEIDPDNYTEDDLKRYREFLETSYFQILKPFAFDLVPRKLPATAPDGSPSSLIVKVPMQLKDSESVLLPTEAYVVKGKEIYVRPKSLQDIENGEYIRPELAKLLYLMETQDVDLAIFNSGTKDEQFNVVDISTADENTVLSSKFDFKNSNWTEQQINPRKDFNAEVNDGSQVRKIMTANVDENWTFTLNGIDYKGQKGANDLLMEIERVNALENKNKISKKIKKDDGSVDVDKALNIIKEGIIEKASDIETLEGMELLSDGKTLLPIELLGKKSQQVLNSIYKKIGKFKVKGAALINKSSFGYTREDQKLEYVDDLQLVMGKDTNGNDIIKYWEAIVPVYDAVIFNYIDENGNLLLDKKGNPLIPEKLLTAFFYRIPTEDKYSMFPIRIKKFSMPAQGGNIILPREATITAGLDFDIDKLYGYYYNFTEQFPPSIQEYTINKFSKENEVSKKILKNFITFAENNTYSNKEDIQEAFPEHYSFYDSFYKMLTSPDTKQVVDSINNKKEYNQFDDHHKLQVTKSSLDSPTGRQNLKLDAYMSLAQTPAFAKSVLNPGNKNRLLALREKKAAGVRDMNYSYADPVNLSENATKNIVGKRLIGIFANANAFYNMIQGVAKIRLRYPYKVTMNGTDYEFDSIGDINESIPRNIAELLFASTEDVKDPVLEILNINEITAGLLTTLLSLTNKNGKEIMSFEDAIDILSDPSIINAVKEVQSTGKRFDDVYKGQYKQLVEISSAYNDIVSAAKVDTQIGPDFYVVESKLEKIDNILTKNIKRKEYPFVSSDVLNILPSGDNNSAIKQLNVYRETLDDEISTFKDLFSFLKPSIKNIVADIRTIAKGNKLVPSLIQKFSYYVYDMAIQHYLNSIGELQKLKTEFPIKLSTYTFPVGTEILQSAFEIKKGVIKTRWVNMSASDILTQQKNAFSTLFIKDPKMATELATYAFLTGTNFTMNSIVKIVPNDFYYTDNGKVIRNIINGIKIEEYLPYGDKSYIPILYNHFESITNKLEVNDKGELEIDAIELLTEPYYHVKGSKDQPNKLYARTEMGFTLIYTKPKEALPNYIVEPIDVTNAPVENSDTTMEAYTITNFEALYASSGAKKSEFDKKDVKKFNNVINKLISRGSPTSSSAGYAREFTEKSLPLNVTNYTSSDVVGISAEGNRSNRIKPDLDLISKAAAANVTFITDAVATDYNIGETEVHEHLKALGYKNNGKGVWTKDPEDLKNDKDKLPCEGDIK